MTNINTNKIYECRPDIDRANNVTLTLAALRRISELLQAATHLFGCSVFARGAMDIVGYETIAHWVAP